MLTRATFVALALVACRDASDPGFEIVKVPLSAYASADASVKGEGGVASTRDGGGDPVVLCVPKPEKQEGDESDEDCPSEYQGRSYDEKATTRHRAKDDESSVCCFRKGRVPHRERAEEE